ncbi:MAG: SEC59/DGK1/VTE5 family protein [Candidatus Aenigmarchaeota archaeon]|nr:SEC59/DGK1/VTE5 family protein [Candidatus Aenigmarchaeota archaeon]MDW8149128.1 SEC59/DGK1/VTE5 family protein [Candidatus Aenigmarchaeota archaeon]
MLVAIVKKIKEFDWFYKRKLIHLSSISIILFELFFGKELLAILIIFVSFLYFVSEVCRIKNVKFPIFQLITKNCSNKKSLNSFISQPLHFALGILISLLLFPKQAFYAGITALIIGDCMAGIVGRNFGRIKIFYNRKKTLEGSLAFFVSTFLFLSFITNFHLALIVALFGALIESIFVKYENLIIPLAVGSFYLLIKSFYIFV